jgi:hypothetical protein
MAAARAYRAADGRLDLDAILAAWFAGVPLTEVARRAEVSRERIRQKLYLYRWCTGAGCSIRGSHTHRRCRRCGHRLALYEQHTPAECRDRMPEQARPSESVA